MKDLLKMSGSFQIEAPTALTMAAWRQMRQTLWPEMIEEENAHETTAMMAANSRFFLRIARNMKSEAAGFVEAALRTDYVNGCST